MSHQQLAVESAKAHVQSLKRNALPFAGAVATAAAALIDSIEAALRLGLNLTAADVPFTHDLVAKIQAPAEREALLNEASLGLGDPSADFVFVGQEHAYDPGDAQKFALEASGLTILWLSGGNTEVAKHIGGRQNWQPLARPITEFPAGYIEMPKDPSRHTWQVISRELLERADLDFAASRGYLIELSALPSPKHKGVRPTPRRMRFLYSFVKATSARRLVFHGKSHEREQDDLARRYLGTSNFRVSAVCKGVSFAEHNAKRVIWCPHLSGSSRITKTQIEAVRNSLS